MKREIYIQEEHSSPEKVVLLGFFFLFWKNLHEHQNSENEFSQIEEKKPKTIKQKKLFIEIRDELNTVKPVNISSLPSLDQFTN